jgi:ferredoxin
VARKLAEALLRGGSGKSLSELLTVADQSARAVPPAIENGTRVVSPNGKAAVSPLAPSPAPTPAPVVSSTPAPAPVTAPATTAVAVAAPDDDLAMEPYIDSARCTTCNECINLNSRLFTYNAEKQATIKDAKGGSFQQLVLAAERCPVGAIHPGTPLNPKEKDLEKWTRRAQPFN